MQPRSDRVRCTKTYVCMCMCADLRQVARVSKRNGYVNGNKVDSICIGWWHACLGVDFLWDLLSLSHSELASVLVAEFALKLSWLRLWESITCAMIWFSNLFGSFCFLFASFLKLGVPDAVSMIVGSTPFTLLASTSVVISSPFAAMFFAACATCTLCLRGLYLVHNFRDLLR